MARPATGYRLSGKRVPSVTTVLGRFKESGGLVHWAWQLGADGKDYREERNGAATSGTYAHHLVEAHIHGETADDSKWPKLLKDRAYKAFGAFQKWEKTFNATYTVTEISLTSPSLQYGGTIDAVGTLAGELVLLDWKTSNSVYIDYILQLAAYGNLWTENYPDKPLTGGFHLLRFSKKDIPSFTHHWWKDVSVAFDMFKHLLAAYNIEESVKELL